MKFRQRFASPIPLLDKYIIIDTQGGYEDVNGLVAALKLSKRFDRTVLGITCVAGRRNMDSTVRDVLIAQQIANTDVHIFKGANRSLLLRQNFPQCIDLNSNFEELDKYPLDQKKKELVQSKAACLFLSEAISKYKTELCIITLGPLTNLAMAYHINLINGKDNQISSIRILGGSYSGVGNVVGHGNSQANFFFDPEAAHVVLTNFKNVYITPIESTLETDMRKDIDQLIQQNKNQDHKTILRWISNKKYALCGPLLNVLPVFKRNISAQVLDVYSEVVLSGQDCSGMMVNNWLRLDVPEGQQLQNTKIYYSLDKPLFSSTLRQIYE